jgi:hypothetical protein
MSRPHAIETVFATRDNALGSDSGHFGDRYGGR